MWVTILSDHLPVVALVGRYPANKLMGREPIPDRTQSLVDPPSSGKTTSGINPSFPGLFRSQGQIAHVLLTLAPLSTLAS